MDRLEEAIRRLADEFSSLTASIGNGVRVAADDECKHSLASLAAAQAPGGVVASAEHARDELRRAIAEYNLFLAQVEQLEQVWLISEDLKQSVRALQKQ